MATALQHPLVERAARYDLEDISAQLCSARDAFKKFPELVTAAELPARLVPFIVKGDLEGIRLEEFISEDRMREIRAEVAAQLVRC